MPQAGTDEAIVQSVNEGYGSVAINAPGCPGGASLYYSTATAFGYTETDLQSVPEGANLGLSCGNPIALANLRQARDHYPPPVSKPTMLTGLLGGGRDRPWIWWRLRRLRRSAEGWREWSGHRGGYDRRLSHLLHVNVRER